jgi:hypothetical protein
MKTQNAIVFGGLCLALAATAPLKAQTALPNVAPDVTLTRREIRLREVPPAVMAWWLDPKRNAQPQTLFSRSADSLGLSETDFPSFHSDAKLPVGIEAVLPKESQNTLVVIGTPQAVNELEEIVNRLDVPLRQAEVEATWIEVSNDELAKLNLQWTPAVKTTKQPGDTTAQVALWKGSAVPILQRWLDAGKAKVIYVPRVVAIEKQLAGISTTAITSVDLRMGSANGETVFTPNDFSDAVPAIGSATGMTFYCKQMEANRVTFDCWLGTSLFLTSMSKSGPRQQNPIPNPKNRPSKNIFLGAKTLLSAQLSLGEVETAIIAGNPAIHFEGTQSRYKNSQVPEGKQTIFFVTARELRRAGQ